MDKITKPSELQQGDFIEIPAWKMSGMVQAVTPADYGSDDARRVMVQEHPDDPARRWRIYHLEPGQFELA